MGYKKHCLECGKCLISTDVIVWGSKKKDKPTKMAQSKYKLGKNCVCISIYIRDWGDSRIFGGEDPLALGCVNLNLGQALLCTSLCTRLRNAWDMSFR